MPDYTAHVPSRRDRKLAPTVIDLQNRWDGVKCYETVRRLRWPARDTLPVPRIGRSNKARTGFQPVNTAR